MKTKLGSLASITMASLLIFAQSNTHATEVTAHRTVAGQIAFGASAFLHPNKAAITPADQGMNPSRSQGTLAISGLGDGYESLLQKCEGARFRNFNIGANPPNNHLDVGECTIFRGMERVGTLTYHGTPARRGRKLHLESYTCEETGHKLVEGEGKNEFTPTLAPPNKLFLGGTFRLEEIVSFNCVAK